ncbi:hypothetical protein M430DRAFT_19694 [Amorphotheca resinae ATCC 22711]|uniref:Anaphase-promoting complex subunit 4 WD40 domain-containing protein n=1 Tax=Amorphotheca resinae ATCC 22711 TaxID=857342 RepID=A0A2T3B000_AMORE|nr:hypothetical protein M430DRAFT_19694 [Amorphotheca resinae ATCC 22711]PSS16721.1 hypothetical protein M430DRAFT_19694 [Amorphotheca resinae ATCC 22711]
MDSTLETPTPPLVASTTETYCCSIKESRLRERRLQHDDSAETRSLSPVEESEGDSEVNYFKSVQWSPDGTTLLASSADNTIRTFILPPTLLDDHSAPISLTPYTTHTHPTSINCLAPYPHFTLSEPTTTLYLSTPADLPIRLTNCLSQYPTPVSTYQLISPTTEAYQTPSSILWSRDGSHFLTGTDCLIALFDISRNGEGPATRLPTIPSKRHKMKGGGVGMRGIVSALSIQPSSPDEPAAGMLAAGTWTRWVGLYDTAGMGGTVATWSIAEAADTHAGIGGTGITQTLWSSCGRYLYVVERRSRGVLVFDVRVMGKLLAWLEGREAETNQRLGVDVFEGQNGREIWAGGVDGVVRVWEGVGQTEGGLKRTWEWKAHDDPVSSTVVHSSGTVVATCSGQRTPLLSDEDDISSDEEESDSDASSGDQSTRSPRSTGRTPDNSIKVWSL